MAAYKALFLIVAAVTTPIVLSKPTSELSHRVGYGNRYSSGSPVGLPRKFQSCVLKKLTFSHNGNAKVYNTYTTLSFISEKLSWLSGELDTVMEL